ncbi:MAG: hypothetical protein QXU42_05055 [Thermoproteota archaeon]
MAAQKKLIYIAGVVIILIVIIAAYWLMTQPAEKPAPTPTPTPTPTPAEEVEFDFETDEQGWAPAFRALTQVQHTTEDAKSGSGSLKIYFDRSAGQDGGAQVVFDTPKDLTGKRLSLWMKVPEEAAAIDIQAKLFVMSSSWAWADAGDPVHFSGKGGQWVELTFDLSTVDWASDIKVIGILVGEWAGGEWSGWFYIDALDW